MTLYRRIFVQLSRACVTTTVAFPLRPWQYFRFSFIYHVFEIKTLASKGRPVTDLTNASDWIRSSVYDRTTPCAGYRLCRVPQHGSCRELCPADSGFLSDAVTVLGDTIKGTYSRYIATSIWRTCPLVLQFQNSLKNILSCTVFCKWVCASRHVVHVFETSREIGVTTMCVCCLKRSGRMQIRVCSLCACQQTHFTQLDISHLF
jgi:hypothetical protein